MSSGPGVVSNERLDMKEILVSSVYSFVILYFLFIVATVLIIIIIFHNRITATATGHHKTIIILVGIISINIQLCSVTLFCKASLQSALKASVHYVLLNSCIYI